MKNPRTIYFIKTLIVIAMGLLARAKQQWFPDVVNLYFGDALYAVMVFYMYSFILPHSRLAYRAVYALVTCFFIEFLQLWEAPFMVEARNTLPGKLILGRGFLWSDLLAYVMGIAAVYFVERWLFKTKK